MRGTLLVGHSLWWLVTCNNHVKITIPEKVMIITLLLCVDLPLLTFDLHEGHHHPRLASGFSFGSHKPLFNIFDPWDPQGPRTPNILPH